MKRMYLLVIGALLVLTPVFFFSSDIVDTVSAQCYQCSSGGWCEGTGYSYRPDRSCTPDGGTCWTSWVEYCASDCSGCPGGGGGSTPTATPTPVPPTPTPTPWPISGRVTDTYGNGVGGIRVDISGQSVTTAADGTYSLSGYIQYGGGYNVTIPDVPTGSGAGWRYVRALGHNGNMGWTWRSFDNPQRDTRADDLGYYHQKMGDSDCAGAHGGLPAGRCNFQIGRNNAVCVGVTRPSEPGIPTGTLLRGKTYYAAVTMRNTGDFTWIGTGGDRYKLGSQAPQDNVNWGTNRFELPYVMVSPVSVPPGQQVTFDMYVRADTAGSYNFQWKMLRELVEWFGATCDGGTFNVVNASSLSGLNVVNKGDASVARRAKTSASSTNTGWNNPIDITLSANRGSGTISRYIVGFYTGAQVNSLQELYDRTANPNNGFTIMWTAQTNWCGNGQNFCVLSQNGNSWWQPLSAGGTSIRSGGNVLYTIRQISGSDAGSATWNVRFTPSFGSKSLKTAGYIVDSNGFQAFEPAKTTTAQ